MKILDVLSSEDKWTKGFYAKDAEGHPVETYHPDACSFCLVGAVLVCGPSSSERNTIMKALYQALTGSYGEVPKFNDDPETTFEDIVSLVKEAGLG